MKIRLIKSVDKIFGMLFNRILPPAIPRSVNHLNNILVIRPGGIGDAVHLIPTLRVLRTRFPESVIDVLTEKRNGAVFDLVHDVSKVFYYDRFSELLRVVRGRYDLVIDTEQWHYLSAIIARLAGKTEIIGFATSKRTRQLTHPVRYSHDDYEMKSFLNLLAPLGLSRPMEMEKPGFLSVSPEAAQKAAGLLGELNSIPFVTLFPGASIPERRWGKTNFAQLAERLHAQGFPIVVVGGKEDVLDGERIVAGKYGLNLAGKTSLSETAAVIEKSALLLSGDSGILHIGVGLGKPTVSLFGPGRARKWAPRGDRHIVINKHLPCSPCTSFGYTPKCPINAKCLSDISVDEVLNAIDKLMIYNRV